MFISDFVNQFSQNASMDKKVAQGSKESAQVSRPAAGASSTSSLNGLQKGMTFEGNVSEINGDKVKLSLSNGESVTARMKADVPITQGQSVFFEVRSNDGSTINIRPISFGIMQNPTILAALDMAGLPQNERNMQMVDAMMREQLPINADNLTEMTRQSVLHPDTSPQTLATMQKAGIPITGEMIQQFENYKESEGAILDTVGDLLDDLADTFSNPSVTTEDVAIFQNNLLSILTTEEGVVPHLYDSAGELILQPEDGEAAIIPEEELPSEEVQEAEEDVKALLPEENAPEETASAGKEVMQKTDAIAFGEAKSQPDVETKDNKALADLPEAKAGEEKPAAPESKAASDTSADPTEYDTEEAPPNTLGRVLSDEAKKELSGLLKDLGLSDKTLFDDKGNLRPEVDTTRLLQETTKFLNENTQLPKDQVLKLLASFGYKDVLKDVMEKRWTLAPEEVASKEKVKDLYAKLSVDMQRLSQVAQEAAKGANSLSQSADSIKNNVDFINNINQAYNYIQLPLKLSGQHATGELYVYSNRKHRQLNDSDELSAFLHFDLDHLGSTDISIKMKQKKVSTDFFLENDISFDLIQKNLPILQEKLEKAGYDCTLSVKHDSQSVDLVEDFLKQDVAFGGDVRRYSFDMMA